MPARKQPDRVGVLPTRQKPHPQHRARVITSMMSGQAVGWSIYLEQLPAMREHLAREFFATWYVDDAIARRRFMPSCRVRAAAALASLGLVAPSVSSAPSAAKKVRR